MTEVEFTSELSVHCWKHDFSDDWPVAAARTSTQGSDVIAHAASKGLINRLMADKHGSPFEHMNITFVVRAPLMVWREHHRHRIACMTGDSSVTRCGPLGTNLSQQTIETMWRNWHVGVPDSIGRTRLLPSCRTNVWVRTYDEQTMLPQPGRVLDVVQTGVKPIVLLETYSGRSIRCTADHQVLTVDGWKRVFELTDRDFVLRSGKRAIRDTPPIPPMLRRGIGVWTSGLREEEIDDVDTCYLCEGKFVRADLVLDHVIPVVRDLTRALDRSNLKPACEPCHRVKTNGEQIYAERMGSTSAAVPDRVSHVTNLGIEEMTYDLVVDEPWHNYLANGLVVHNSYNEESGRYKKLEPLFYSCPPERPLQTIEGSKQMDYEYAPGTPSQLWVMRTTERETCTLAYETYERRLEVGIIKEVARKDLPLSIMSTCVVTMNARALMNFLSLRTRHEDALHASKPQWEINQIANRYEEFFAIFAPQTYEAFNRNGRVAP